MKKKYVVMVLAGLCAFTMIGCGSAANETTAVSTTVSVSNETSASSVNEEKDYSELIGYLDEEDYDSASAYIDNLKAEKEEKDAGDIEDYLVEVDLTEDNFSEYFEFENNDFYYNEFREKQEDGIGSFVRLRSLKYDEGLILYEINDDIQMSFSYVDMNGDTKEVTNPLIHELLGNYWGGETNFMVERIKPGKITFIKDEYVESYEEISTDGEWTNYEIKLKNGETICHTCYMDYKY